jgi:hypothetical protein
MRGVPLRGCAPSRRKMGVGFVGVWRLSIGVYEVEGGLGLVLTITGK